MKCKGLWHRLKKDNIGLLYQTVSVLRKAGKKYSDVAKQLGCSRKTVASFCKEMGIKERAKAVPPPMRVCLEKNVKSKQKRYRMREYAKEYLELIGFWKERYVVFDAVGQPHISSTLSLKSLKWHSDAPGELILQADRLTGEKVYLTVQIDRLEAQRIHLGIKAPRKSLLRLFHQQTS